MSHFAKVENGKVVQVIVAEQEFIESGVLGHGWIQTSYNTKGNRHVLGGTPLRGNYAMIGDTYDEANDVFYSPKPFDSWSLQTSSWTWEAPVAYPSDGKIYIWDEPTLSWTLLVSDNFTPTPVETLP
jgi:hypothetical protein